MGLMERVFSLLFGGSTNVVRETVEVFRENAEAGAVRSASVQADAMAEFGTEFLVPRKGWFDRFIDGLNRLPRPAMALGTLGLFVSAMVDPLWFSERMQGIALVPEPLWWLLGVIVSFYFGARHQVKAQDFQREIAGTVARVPEVLKNIEAIRNAAEDTQPDVEIPPVRLPPVVLQPDMGADTETNPALDDWRRARG